MQIGHMCQPTCPWHPSLCEGISYSFLHWFEQFLLHWMCHLIFTKPFWNAKTIHWHPKILSSKMQTGHICIMLMTHVILKYFYTFFLHKNPIKEWWLEPSQGRRKRKAKERPKDAQPIRTKKRERANPFHGRKLSHPWPL